MQGINPTQTGALGLTMPRGEGSAGPRRGQPNNITGPSPGATNTTSAIPLEGLAKICHDRLSVDGEARKSLISEELALQRELKGVSDKIEEFRKCIFGSPELHVFA